MRPGRLGFVVESGTDVRLVDGLAERFDLTVLARRIEGGVEISHPPARAVPTLVGPASRAAFAWWVGKFLWQHRRRLECVLVQSYGLAALAANVTSRFTGTPTFMLVCSPVEAYYRCRQAHPEPGKVFRRAELWGLEVLARLNAVVGRHYLVLSHYLAEVVRRHGGRRPIHIVPVYGVDTERFTPPHQPKPVLRERLGLPPNSSLIFFSSRVAPEKDAETLLRALRCLHSSGRDWWLLHRSGQYRGFLQVAERFGLADRVIAGDAVHPQHQLPQEYQACDLCVQASRQEGLGFSPLEALACGVPVVAAAVGGLRETILHGETGWTYRAGDAEGLAECIQAALDQPEEAARRAARGRELVCARYERQKVFERLAALLEHASRERRGLVLHSGNGGGTL